MPRTLSRSNSSQQVDRPLPADHPTNLWEPGECPEGCDYGPHRSFDNRVAGRSIQMRTYRHHGIIATAGSIALAAGLTPLIGKNDRHTMTRTVGRDGL